MIWKSGFQWRFCFCLLSELPSLNRKQYQSNRLPIKQVTTTISSKLSISTNNLVITKATIQPPTTVNSNWAPSSERNCWIWLSIVWPLAKRAKTWRTRMGLAWTPPTFDSLFITFLDFVNQFYAYFYHLIQNIFETITRIKFAFLLKSKNWRESEELSAELKRFLTNVLFYFAHYSRLKIINFQLEPVANDGKVCTLFWTQRTPRNCKFSVGNCCTGTAAKSLFTIFLLSCKEFKFQPILTKFSISEDSILASPKATTFEFKQFSHISGTNCSRPSRISIGLRWWSRKHWGQISEDDRRRHWRGTFNVSRIWARRERQRSEVTTKAMPSKRKELYKLIWRLNFEYSVPIVWELFYGKFILFSGIFKH